MSVGERHSLRCCRHDLDPVVNGTRSHAVVTGTALAVYLGVVTATTALQPKP